MIVCVFPLCVDVVLCVYESFVVVVVVGWNVLGSLLGMFVKF